MVTVAVAGDGYSASASADVALLVGALPDFDDVADKLMRVVAVAAGDDPELKPLVEFAVAVYDNYVMARDGLPFGPPAPPVDETKA